MRVRIGGMIGLVLAAMAATASVPIVAQQPEAAHRPPPRALKLRQLTPNVYWSSEGGNVGVVIGRDGVIVFDATGSPARAAELQTRIAEVTPKPIKAVILSHSDGDHVDGIGGFPAGVPVFATPATQREMRDLANAGQRGISADHLPNRIVAARQTLTLAGEPVQLLHWAPAHTAGDLIAWFPRLRVAFAADIFCMDQPRPYIKPELNGSSAGWVTTARAILALNPKWIVVGHGEPQTPANLRNFVAQSAAERIEIARLAREGKSLPDIEAEVHEPQPSTVPTPPNAHLAHFAKVVYGEVTAPR